MSRSCKYCDTPGMEWKQFGERWRLVDRIGHVHYCRSFAPTNHWRIDFPKIAKQMAERIVAAQ